MRKKLLVSMTLLIAAATVYVLWRGTPARLHPEVQPNTIEANTPAIVTISVRLQDPAFRARSVDLTRVNAHAIVLPDTVMVDEDGTNPDGVPGTQFFLRMRDDGTKGDRVANDGVFTRRVMLKESPGPIYFLVDAAFEETPRHAVFDRPSRPIRSAPLVVTVRP